MLIATVFALLYAFLATPLYKATATLQISSYEPVLLGGSLEESMKQSSRDQEYLGTRIEEVKSFAVADRVLSRGDVKNRIFPDPAGQKSFVQRLFGSQDDAVQQKSDSSAYNNSTRQIHSYLGLIEVSPIRRTSLVKLEVTTDDPALSADISNIHAREYVDWVRETRIQRQSEGAQFLRTQAEELRLRVAKLERELADYAEEHEIVALNKDENITVSKMSELSHKLTDSTQRRIEAEKLFEEAQASLSQAGSAGFDDPSLQTTRALLAQLQSEYGNLLQKFTPEYPRVMQLKAQIDDLKASIESGRAQVVMGLKARALAALETERNLEEELEKQKSLAFELSKSQVEYNIMNRELQSSRDLQQSLLRQIKETELAVQSNASTVALLDSATAPLNASFPNKKLITLLGLVIGTGAGLVGAFVLNHLDNTIRTTTELSFVTALPTLGYVPEFEEESSLKRPRLLLAGGKRGYSSSANQPISPDAPAVVQNGIALQGLAFVERPKSLAAEAYRTIRTALLLSRASEPAKKILVTSCLPSEGKTTTSTNLAATLASQGKRILFIDADMRKPSAWRYFKIAREEKGLAELLTGSVSFEDVLHKTHLEGVFFVPSGSVAPNPAELLGAKAMEQLLENVADDYDHIIIDSPPVLPVTDAVLLARIMDGVILVVKGGETPKRVIRDAMERLRATRAPLLGTVLNHVRVTGSGDYYYSQYYSRYYQGTDGQETASKAVGS
jgi:capsular exopolysaccharide synthesis family protein